MHNSACPWHTWAQMSNFACGMSSQTSWITRHNCTLVSGGGSRGLIGQSVRYLTDARLGTGRWLRWPGGTAFHLRKSCVRQIEKGKVLYRHPVEPCGTPWLFRMGPQYGLLEWSVSAMPSLHVITDVQGPVSLRLMTSQFKDIVTRTQN